MGLRLHPFRAHTVFATTFLAVLGVSGSEHNSERGEGCMSRLSISIFRESLCVMLFVFLGAGSTANAQELNLIPRLTTQFGGYPQPFLDACNNMDQWPTVASVTTYLGSTLGDLQTIDDSTLSTCFANMLNAGFKLSLEVAPFQPGGCGDGSGCYNAFSPVLDRLLNLGASVTRIRFQEPLTYAKQINWSREDAVNQTVSFMALVRQNYPALPIAFTSVEAYPYLSAADLNWWIAALNSVSQGAGIPPPDYFEIDYNPHESGSSWEDIRAIQNQSHATGWKFSFIFIGDECSDDTTCWFGPVAGTAYVVSYALAPLDMFTFESWLRYVPSRTIPESDSITFMGSVRYVRDSGWFPR
jgi:hypothetical protein